MADPQEGGHRTPLHMRVHLGAIPSSPDFTPDAPWKPLQEPTFWLAQFTAVPIGIAAAVLIAVLWFVITPLRDAMFIVSLPTFLLWFAGIAVVHELIHAAIHPMAGRSPHSILGFWPSRGLFYAHYDGELTRNRFIAILLMPLAVISLIPLVVAAVAQVAYGWVVFVSTFNALLACVDMLGANSHPGSAVPPSQEFVSVPCVYSPLLVVVARLESVGKEETMPQTDIKNIRPAGVCAIVFDEKNRVFLHRWSDNGQGVIPG